MRSYHFNIKPETADLIYEKLYHELITRKRFLETDISASSLSKELDINLRYISTVMAIRFGYTFNTLVNRLRTDYARRLLTDSRYNHLTCEQIGSMAGFNNRQSFYTAFRSHWGVTPAALRHFQEKNINTYTQ